MAVIFTQFPRLPVLVLVLVLVLHTRNSNGINVKKLIVLSEDYGKAIPVSEEMDGSVGSLPICCHMETDDVLFTQCGNSLDYGGRRNSWFAPAHLMSTEVEAKFRLEKSFLTCKSSNRTASLFLHENLYRGNHFLPDGYFKYDNEYYRPDEYCINGFNDEKLEIFMCKVNCSDPMTPCINKCCGLNEIYSFGSGDSGPGCVAQEAEDIKWFPTLYHDLSTKLSAFESGKLNPHIIQNVPSNFKYNCASNKTTVFPFGKTVAKFLSSYTKKPYLNLPFRVRKDGWLLYPQKHRNGTARPVTKKLRSYCIDGVQDYGETVEYTNNETETILFLCSGGPEIGGVELTSPELDPNQTETETETETESPVNQTSRLPTLSFIPEKEPLQWIPPVSAHSIPTCCRIEADVNDGMTHHCKNRRSVDTILSASIIGDLDIPTANRDAIWNVPSFFMTTNERENFTLKKSPVSCQSGKFQFQGFIHNFENRGKAKEDKINAILPDGFLKYENQFYSQDEYCVNGISKRIIEVLICKPYCNSPDTPCIQKCCGLNEIYSLGMNENSNRRGCEALRPGDHKWQPNLFYDMNVKLSPDEMKKMKPHIVQKYPPSFQNNCYNNITLAFPFSKDIALKLASPNEKKSFKHLQFRVRKDGKILYSYPDQDGTSYNSIFNRDEYCIDGVRDYGETDIEPFVNYENQTMLFICAVKPNIPPPTEYPYYETETTETPQYTTEFSVLEE